MIDQTPFFVFIFSFNVFLAFFATLGNTLSLIALHKVSSIHPPTKFLLCCLVMSNFCIGVIVHPLLAAILMQIERGKWYILHMTVSTLNFIFCGFSLATATAISVDRLLALLLGLRYRNTVTLRQVRCLVLCFLLANIAFGFTYHLTDVFSRRCQQRWICWDHNFLVALGLVSRQIKSSSNYDISKPKYDINMLDMNKQTTKEHH